MRKSTVLQKMMWNLIQKTTATISKKNFGILFMTIIKKIILILKKSQMQFHSIPKSVRTMQMI